MSAFLVSGGYGTGPKLSPDGDVDAAPAKPAEGWSALRGNSRVHPQLDAGGGGSEAPRGAAQLSAGDEGSPRAAAPGASSSDGTAAMKAAVERLRNVHRVAELARDQRGEKPRSGPPRMPNQWVMLGCMLGWEEAARRCITEASTMGVISALLAGITYASLLSPPAVGSNPFSYQLGNHVPPLALLRCFSCGAFLAIIFSGCSVLVCAIVITQLNIQPSDDDIRAWLTLSGGLMMANMNLFAASLIGLFVNMVSAMAINFHMADTIAALGVVLLVSVMMTSLAFHSYFRISLPSIQRHYRKMLAASIAPQPGDAQPPEPALEAGAGAQPSKQQE